MSRAEPRAKPRRIPSREFQVYLRAEPELSRTESSRAKPSRIEVTRALGCNEPSLGLSRTSSKTEQRSRAKASRALSPEPRTSKSGSIGSDQIWMNKLGTRGLPKLNVSEQHLGSRKGGPWISTNIHTVTLTVDRDSDS